MFSIWLLVTQAKTQCQTVVHTRKSSNSTLFKRKKTWAAWLNLWSEVGVKNQGWFGSRMLTEHGQIHPRAASGRTSHNWTNNRPTFSTDDFPPNNDRTDLPTYFRLWFYWGLISRALMHLRSFKGARSRWWKNHFWQCQTERNCRKWGQSQWW